MLKYEIVLPPSGHFFKNMFATWSIFQINLYFTVTAFGKQTIAKRAHGGLCIGFQVLS